MPRRRRDLPPREAELAALAPLARYQCRALRRRLVMRGYCCGDEVALALIADQGAGAATIDTDWPDERDSLLARCVDAGIGDFASAELDRAAERWDATRGEPWLWRLASTATTTDTKETTP